MTGPDEITPGLSEAEIEPRPPADAPRPGLRESSLKGARAGLRRTSYVVAPIAILAVIPGFALSALGVGAGRGLPLLLGWEVPAILYRPVGFYLGFGVLGLVLGAFLGLIAGMLGRARPGTLAARAWAAVNRPIGRRRKRRVVAGPVEVAPAPRRGRIWRWVLGALATLALLATVAGLGAGIYLGRAVDARLAAAIAAADRDDPSWRIDDLMAHRDPVPDEENSALVVGEALASVPESWPLRPPPSPGQPRQPPGEAEGALSRLAETPDNVRLDDASARAIRDELETYGESIRLARAVADYRRGRHELELGPTLIDTLLPETQASRVAARLLAADAAIRAHDGDLDGALDSCRAVLGVARSIGDEPFLISGLVRIAIGSVAMNTARRVLGQGESSDAALTRLQALLLDERTQPLLLIGMKGERAQLDELIRRIGSGEVPISALSDAPKSDVGLARAAIAPWGKLMFDNQRAVGLEWMNEAVAIARRPAPERPALWKAWEDNLFRVRKSPFGFITSTLPMLMMPAVSAADTAQSRYEAHLGAMALLLAAERHRRKTGDWPSSIAAIAPEILPNPPADPFTGASYRMERRDGQLLVYSVGPNGKDDHGTPSDPKRSRKDGPDDIGVGAWDVSLRRRPADVMPTPADGKPR